MENLNERIDALINDFVPKKIKGMTVSVSKGNEFLYLKSVGVIEELNFKFTNDTIYDLASLTKPLVTSLLILKLIEIGKISLWDTIDELDLFHEFKNIRKFSIENLLTHTTGLPPDRPLYKEGKTKEAYLKFIDRESSYIIPGKREIYSDLNYIILGFIIEEIYGKTLDKVWNNVISDPLDLKNSFFNPNVDIKRIAPSEYSEERGLLWGKVNDEKAYYLGGVAGNAGLFSNIYDINKILYSFVSGNLVSKRTVEIATTNRNTHLGGIFGLGWMIKSEKKEIRSESYNYTGFLGDLSPNGTFGHTGFTGTSICVNKEKNIFCVILSNSTYPKRDGKGEIIRFRRLFHNIIFSILG